MTIAELTAVLPLQRRMRASSPKATVEPEAPLHDCATAYVLRFLGVMAVLIVALGATAFLV